MLKLSLALVAFTLLTGVISSPLRQIPGTEAGEELRGWLTNLFGGGGDGQSGHGVLLRRADMESDGSQNMDASSEAHLIGPNEHTGLAGLGDHLGVALKEVGEALGDLL
ncbi:hypothetical protein GALMADRAFT_283617 [Galerina marginata CBS 339.88]|uniref:Uncharacterized protein n=1 Tax=Galerina marginata (strain CBS 339.88) TaxID=685588 RepID=A0A067SBE1_GALM3|nr:hypothetical protein GALMADRAFT_283617 [Galerina marginata CBS 339.88]